VPTAAFTTLGCKVNQYETQKILESFESAGFDVVPFDQAADVYVVNTCSVTADAEAKSRYTVRRAARTNPGAKFVVTGCAAQMSLNKGEAFAGADLVVPHAAKSATLAHVLEAFPGLTPGVAARPRQGQAFAGRTRATLKVQDGCDVLCSYCSIPFTRPGLRSRPWREVLAESQSLAAQGFQEAVLTGVLIGAYGPETGSGGPSFEELVETLARESGLARLRLSSIEMHQVTEPIVALARDGVVAPHFHIPLQSGDTQVLRDMNRRYGQREYLELCAKLARDVPDASVTTDVMVGFPTETDERFASSLHVVQEAQFLKAHVFRFSPRPGTPADRWGDPVPPDEKRRRAEALSAAARETGAARVRRTIGRTLRVLFEGKLRPDGLLEGSADNGVPVRASGPQSLARTLRWVRVGAEKEGVAYGEVVSSPSLRML
jgi:threonylcarbamoyladenosine tRNA methylthiotransferase MtaB